MKPEHYRAVLGVHPTSRGMGWVTATSPVTLVDWGVIRAKGDKNAVCLRRLERLIETFSPAVIVMRGASGSSRRRVKRIQKLVGSVVQLARARNIETQMIAQAQLRAHFERFGATTREDIALFLAANIEALSSRVPRKREPWMSEDARLGLFDAAALVVSFFIERDLDENPFAAARSA